MFGFLLDKRKHQAAVILLIAAMSVQGVMNLKVQFVSKITPNKLVCERCIECIGNAITYFIGCCEVSHGAGSKFVPQNSSIMQFDTTPIQSWLFFFFESAINGHVHILKGLNYPSLLALAPTRLL